MCWLTTFQLTFSSICRFLKNTFGECGVPKVAWQIDTFGHSAEAAMQFADMGFDGLFVGRIDQEDYRERVVTKTMEHIWRPDTSLGNCLFQLCKSILYWDFKSLNLVFINVLVINKKFSISLNKRERVLVQQKFWKVLAYYTKKVQSILQTNSLTNTYPSLTLH